MKSRVLSAPAMAPRRLGGLPLRRLVRDISSVLMISGLLLVIDAGVTLIWQEPVTAVIGLIQRANIDKQYLSFRTAPLTPVQRHALHIPLRTIEWNRGNRDKTAAQRNQRHEERVPMIERR